MAGPSSRKPVQAASPVRRGPVLLAVVLGSGIVFLDGTIVNVALETIGAELPATAVGTLEGLTYVTSGYLAVLAALLIPAGALSDAYGRRRVFALRARRRSARRRSRCGLAPTMELLIVARLLQGAAGAFLVPGALSIITATFAGEERGRAIGVWAAATAALTTLGPLVGGVLVQSVSWRAAFLVNLPLVVVALLALRRVPESRDEDATGRVDWLGAAVAVLAVGGLAFGLTRGQESGWQDPVAFAALAVGAVALVAFPVLMAVRPNPLVPLDLFRSRSFARREPRHARRSTARSTRRSSFQSLFLQGTLGYSPLAAGIVSLPTGVLLVLLSTTAGRLAGPARGAAVHGRRAAAHGRRAPLAGPDPADERGVGGRPGRPGEPRAAASTTSSTSCRGACSSGSVSRCSSPR